MFLKINGFMAKVNGKAASFSSIQIYLTFSEKERERRRKR
jgi:hypothetical protein